MDYLRFNLNLRQVDGLACTKLRFKKRIYATVSIVGCSASKQRTSVGKYVGKNPTWDNRSSMRFYVEVSKLQQNHVVVIIQLHCKQMMGGDKVMGEVHIPLKQLHDNCRGINTVTNYGCLQVMTPSGKRQGFLYFTFEFGESLRAAAINNPLRPLPSAPFLDYFALNC